MSDAANSYVDKTGSNDNTRYSNNRRRHELAISAIRCSDTESLE